MDIREINEKIQLKMQKSKPNKNSYLHFQIYKKSSEFYGLAESS
jgi:hypothetical protein